VLMKMRPQMEMAINKKQNETLMMGTTIKMKTMKMKEKMNGGHASEHEPENSCLIGWRWRWKSR
jgi:hypothetical protein